MLIHSHSGLVFEYLDDFIEYAGRNGQVFVSLGDVFNNRDLNR
jgi:hypothetical protein